MQTIRLRINDKIYKNILWLLGKFDKEELQIIEEDKQFSSTQEFLVQELDNLNRGVEELLDIDDVDRELENIIKKHED